MRLKKQQKSSKRASEHIRSPFLVSFPQHPLQFLQVPHDAVRPGIGQFRAGAVAVEHADDLQAVGMGTDDVVAAVAHHDGLRRVDGGARGQHVAYHLGLVGAAQVGRVAAHEVEAADKAEVFQYPAGQRFGLGGGHVEVLPRLAQAGEQVGHAGIRHVLVHAPRQVILLVGLVRLGHLAGREAVQVAERLLQRRPNEGRERADVRHLDAEVPQRVLHRRADAHHGVGQRAVQVEEDVLHICV